MFQFLPISPMSMDTATSVLDYRAGNLNYDWEWDHEPVG